MNDLQPISYNSEYQYSNQVAETTMGDLVSAVRRRKWLVLLIVAIVLAGTAAVTARMHKMWRAEVQLILIQRPSEGKAVEDPSYISPISETPDTQVAMLSSSSMAQRTQEWYENQAAQTGQPVPDEVLNGGQFTKNVTVQNPKDSNIIALEVDAPSHDLAINIANAVALAFVQWKKELAQQDIRETEAQLETEIVDAKSAMENAVSAEYAYRNAHHLVNVTSQEGSALSLLQSDEGNVTSIQQDLASQEAALSTLGSQLKTLNKSLMSGNGDVRNEDLILTLQSDLSTLEIQRAAEAQKVTPLYPGQLPVMDAQIRDLRRRLSAATKATVDNGMPSLANQGALDTQYKQEEVTVALDEAKLAAATQLRDQEQNSLNSMPKFDTTITRLDLDVQAATQRYNSVQAALNSTRLQINTTTGNVQITQAAIADVAPFKPNWQMNMTLGAVLGLLLSFITTLVLEQSDKRVQDVAQIGRYKLGTILGILPPLDRSGINAAFEGRSIAVLSEHFSVARTNLLALLAQSYRGTGQVVLVTSATRGEGKSLVLAEMARTLADAGKRVIVVDANLRSPALSEYFPTDEAEGLSNVLLERTALDDVVTTVNPYLSVLHSGAGTDEPTRLVSTPPFISLLNSLRTRADVILVDSPAAEAADPLLIAPHVDYVLQVIGSNRSKEKDVLGTLTALSAVSDVGIFVNFADLKQISPHQLVNAAARTSISGKTSLTQITGPKHLINPDSDNDGKLGRTTAHNDIIQVPTVSGEVQ
jgi:succinoglycan biosynthesis transport protein ExoP